jgi:dephospho-CoA kinase
MSAWPGKFVISLTGNIATGKRGAQNAGARRAYGIDADAWVPRHCQDAQATGSKYIRHLDLGPDGQVDRSGLPGCVLRP